MLERGYGKAGGLDKLMRSLITQRKELEIDSAGGGQPMKVLIRLEFRTITEV